MFASIELGGRIERAECRLVADCTRAVAARTGDPAVFTTPIGGGLAAYAGPGMPMNKVAGLGFPGPVDTASLVAVEAAYAERGAPVQVELATLADRSIASMLTARGYTLEGFEDVLGLALPVATAPDVPGPGPGLEIEVVQPPDDEAWTDVVVSGFCVPDTQGIESHESFPREMIEPMIRDMAAAEGMVRYLVRRDGVPAGGGTMRICDGVLQLCGASTLVDHRRRGVQTALLARRLADAGAQGADIAVVTTLPGSKSQENVQRQGFRKLYTRAVLVKPPAG